MHLRSRNGRRVINTDHMISGEHRGGDTWALHMDDGETLTVELDPLEADHLEYPSSTIVPAQPGFMTVGLDGGADDGGNIVTDPVIAWKVFESSMSPTPITASLGLSPTCVLQYPDGQVFDYSRECFWDTQKEWEKAARQKYAEELAGRARGRQAAE